MNKINSIYIADLGLRNDYRTIIENINSKIEIILTDVDIGRSDKIFSGNWVNAISQKTIILQKLIQNGHTPIVMLDCDTVIIEDFSDVIDLGFDIQVCKRTTPLLRRDGLLLEYIASFFAVNNTKGGEFVQAWINRIEERIRLNIPPPYETPAMVETIQKNKGLHIGFIDEKIISCENNYYSGITKIVHAKSDSRRELFSVFRLAKINKLPNKTLYLLDFKERLPFLMISMLYALKRKLKKVKKIIIK